MTSQPTLLFDGDCGFCSRTIDLAKRWIQPRAQCTPWQSADLPAMGVTEERADREILWISPDSGTIWGGPRALAAMLKSGRRRWAWLGIILVLPPVSWAAHAAYRAIARNRHRLPGGTTACSLPAHLRNTHRSP
ncbi:DCC1-like thiol-disulfide oxidoreductase family protein [Streptomyces sp. 21So2-11]|uniref:thiol-disulfide oxidoreductase DCC family protein n=1 Tax=Streptomyces sp. 21So2-11 TaxID=3144408 RepID=UPI00321BC0EC